LVRFLQNRWGDLSTKERQDFHVPLKHRRHHRLLLERALGLGPPTQDLLEREGQA
jgi:hypothetical protein